ncbi:MAG: hypothetical protein RMI91_13110 [Gemmatales bacterium]|nr:hypothetical protein [Gemmatales bacterium]MDW7995583.1 hypothetical protein [Gemmatales bacterium]
MSAPSPKHHRTAHSEAILPGTCVRIQDRVRVGQATLRSGEGSPSNGQHQACEVQVRTVQESGEIRYIEVQCSCGRTIRLRCEYEAPVRSAT